MAGIYKSIGGFLKENYFDTLAKGWNTPQRKNTED